MFPCDMGGFMGGLRKHTKKWFFLGRGIHFHPFLRKKGHGGVKGKMELLFFFKLFLFLVCLYYIFFFEIWISEAEKSTITTKSRSQFWLVKCDICWITWKSWAPAEQNEISIEFPVHELLSQRSHTNSVSLKFVIQMWNLVYYSANKLSFIKD